MEGRDLLVQGISAAKAGKREEARLLLAKVVSKDSGNERAWLWLSGVVDSDENRRLCLENVLALNPDNRLAKKGLERLVRSRSTQGSEEQVVADTLLYYGSANENSGSEATGPVAEIRPFDASDAGAVEDVWSTDEEICAFCACVVDGEAKQCVQCGRALLRKEYRYSASVALHFFWVVLVGLSVILTFQSLFQLRVTGEKGMALTYGAIAVLLLVLVVGIYLRLFIAHIVSVFVIILVVVLSVLSFFQPFEPVGLGSGGVDPSIVGVASDFMGRLSLFLKIVQMTVAALALFYALFRVSPEFDRVSVRLIAASRKGLHTAVDFHMIARRLAGEGMWASAILHWQRAAAIEPGSIIYQRSLAKAYLRLGFYERGYGILEHAQWLPMQPSTKVEIDRLLQWSRQKLNAASGAA